MNASTNEDSARNQTHTQPEEAAHLRRPDARRPRRFQRRGVNGRVARTVYVV